MCVVGEGRWGFACDCEDFAFRVNKVVVIAVLSRMTESDHSPLSSLWGESKHRKIL